MATQTPDRPERNTRDQKSVKQNVAGEDLEANKNLQESGEEKHPKSEKSEKKPKCETFPREPIKRPHKLFKDTLDF
ncbi:hypothetical protein ACFL2H_07645 [Planctomycetota bacterium]